MVAPRQSSLAAPLLLLLCGLAQLLPGALGFHLSLAPSEEQCFFETLSAGEPLAGSFQVKRGGSLDVDVRVTSPSGARLFAAAKESEARFDVVAAEAGKYEVCFSNLFSTVSSKAVTVAVHAGHGELIEAEVAKREHLEPVENLVGLLSDQIMKLSEQQRYLRRRSHRHQLTTENTSQRVLFSTITEFAVLVGMNLWQIYYLRRFFEVKTRI